MRFVKNITLFIVFILSQSCQQSTVKPVWPEISSETKPWTRWWWHGSALTKEGITAEMEAYQAAGIGGLEITPIYGVHGYEDKFVNYLSPQWMELFVHTLTEGERLGLGIDMATGTGWPFGGPSVTDEDASKNFQFKIYEIGSGASLSEKIEFIQQPFLRAVGNQIYEVHESFSTEKTSRAGTRKEPLIRVDPKQIDIKNLKQPISANKNLQSLAIDQVVFERPLKLVILMAYSDKGEKLDLTDKVDNKGKLRWKAGDGRWKLYAIFEGSHGKMVERAGPGGEGYVIDHFSASALSNYLKKFDTTFVKYNINSLRSFFNDSYEVDDARGVADWTPTLFDEFLKRRGYSLEENLPALLGNDAGEKNERVLSDYRETISELVLANFTTRWRDWAHDKSALVRNQAHGSPSNILDLYAAVDIPEIEGVDPLRMKMASSAANVTGKRLISSESATWLNEHFESNLADIKIALDRFMLNGINHIFYHGTAYSPPGENWPGWLFYASIHMNPRNSLWTDAAALNQYVARCQSFLQNTKSDNDILLYYPIYDKLATRGEEMVEHFDGIGKQFENTAFHRNAKSMLARGYSFDYISDTQLKSLKFEGGSLVTQGGRTYKTIVLPHCRYIPLGTFQKLVDLVADGATVMVTEGLPESAAGYADLEVNRKAFDALLNKCRSGEKVESGILEAIVGKGRVIMTDSVETLLSYASLRRESMVDQNIHFIRKKSGENKSLYFIANSSDAAFEGWVPLTIDCKSVVIYDPMNGEFGKADLRSSDYGVEVFLQLCEKQTLILETHNEKVVGPTFPILSGDGDPFQLNGKWNVTFNSGGPALPATIETDSLISWTRFGTNDYPAFSGTATYTLRFAKPSGSPKGWLLNLGTVKETAAVSLNGKTIGTLIGPTFQCYIGRELIKDDNVLEIKVSNLMANRIADLDKRGVFWKKFYNINFPARKSENRKNGLFDASAWEWRESGLLGPVTLLPMTLK